MSSPLKVRLRVGRLLVSKGGRKEVRLWFMAVGGKRARERKRERMRAILEAVEAAAKASDEVVKDFYDQVTGFKVTMMQPQGAHFILHGLVNVTDVIVRYV
jgi:hypothetical protein